MTAVNDLPAYKYTGAGSATSTSTSKSSNSSGSSDTSEAFMSLLLAQMRNQSPMDPMDDNQMISQMAQLNSLQELQSINASLQELAGANRFLTSAGLIGKYAKFLTLDEEDNIALATGKVGSVVTDGDEIGVMIGDRVVAIKDLVEVSDTEIVLEDEEDAA